ncbi:hypothetical protein GCM10017643_43040 [Ancylobacter dichloromethanicus]|uniref:Uncharacterized protein n=1 Tax=Ancylobacter dichloromethanicus TaxID=518825 RepID=A0A9W6N1G6_9HYPH|nr:hypothetical protein GCM10017643_43040 [Ancylobacter dichloromethanicus]
MRLSIRQGKNEVSILKTELTQNIVARLDPKNMVAAIVNNDNIFFTGDAETGQLKFRKFRNGNYLLGCTPNDWQ